MAMRSLLMLDPEVILSPWSFAVHLALLGHKDRPLGIPLAWLWEELSANYSILHLADTLEYFGSNIDTCLKTQVASKSNELATSVALLVAGVHLGLLEPLATKHTADFLDKADWASYFGDALGHNWEPIYLSNSLKRRAVDLASAIVCADSGMSSDQLDALIERNQSWETRTSEEYPIYDHARKLNIRLVETMAAVHLGVSVSTPNPETRAVLVSACSTSSVFLPPKKLPFQSLMEGVLTRHSKATVREICDLVGVRHLAEIFDGAEELCEFIVADIISKELAKDTTIYLLGLVPVLGNLSNALGGAQLLWDLWKARRKENQCPCDALLYFGSTATSGGKSVDGSHKVA